AARPIPARAGLKGPARCLWQSPAPYSSDGDLLHDRDRGGARRRARHARPGHHPDGAGRQSATLEPADAAARHPPGDRGRSLRDPHLHGGEVMVLLTRIYTRGGDKGETSLVDGTRVKKHALRVEAYGTGDEANAAAGLARLHAEGEADAMLARIQHDLCGVGADLATPQDGRQAGGALRVTAGQVERLEREIDALIERLSPLRSFVLPGGTPAAA